EPRVQLQYRPRLAAHLVFRVSVAQEGERAAIGSGGGLDDIRQKLAPVGIGLEIVDVTQILAARLHMPAEVEIGPVGDTLELALAERKPVLDVRAARRVMCELRRLVLAQ